MQALNANALLLEASSHLSAGIKSVARIIISASTTNAVDLIDASCKQQVSNLSSEEAKQESDGHAHDHFIAASGW